MIDRSSVHTGQAGTHLLPRLYSGRLVDPVHSPWRLSSPAAHTTIKQTLFIDPYS